MERAKQLGKIDARCILETACNLIDHAGRVTYELRGVAIAIHLNGVDSCQRLCDSLGDLRHDIDVAIGEKIGVLHTVVCFRLGLDAGGDTLAMCLLSGAVSLTLNIVFSCNYHVVFCPKYRRPVLVDGVDDRFKEIARSVADELGFEIVEMEVMPDHVHLLLSVDPQLSIHRAVKRIKGRSSHDLRTEFPWLKSRIPTLWTNSYFVSTVGGVSLAQVRKYIERQKEV